MQAHLKKLLEYDKWASDTLLNKFEHQFPQNQRIYQLMSHLISAKRIWLDRCLQLPLSAILWADRLPDEMRMDMENYHLAWLDFIDNITDADFDKGITYTNSKGDTFTTLLTDIVAHVINHGTHHRGNIIILMKEEGFVPPNLDYISFVRLA